MIEAAERKKYLENFEKVYTSLNSAQKKAVEAIEGPVLVIAGPGTGKTQVLTARIANILLKTDTPSWAILALTFTETGVRAMRERLLSLIGPEAYYVNIYTFHSFCSDIIKDNPDKFILSEELEPLSELERVQIFRQILDEGNFELLRPFGSRYYYVRALIKNIQDLKREGISPENLEEVLGKLKINSSELRKGKERNDKDFDEKDLQKNFELLEVYKKYQEKLKEKARYDFEDMIDLVVAAFEKDKDFLRPFQERYQYLLLDEFQDTNTPQNKVVELLAEFWGTTANVFAVGDDQQSIYRFQGASLENILFFHRLYPQAKIIALKENYRSSQEIIDAASELIEHNQANLGRFLKGIERQLISRIKDETKESLKVGHFKSGVTESFFVGHKIKELLALGIEPSQIAVIYRHNADATDFADTFSRLKIVYDLKAGADVLKDHDLEKLLRLLGVILKIRTKEEDLDLFTLFNYEFLVKQFGFDYLDTLKLARFASDLKVNFLEAILHPDFAKNKIVTNPPSFTTFVQKLLDWQKAAANATFVAFFEKVVDESGFLNFLLKKPDSVEKLNRLNSLFGEVKKLNLFDHRLNLERFSQDLAVLTQSHIPLTEKSLEIKRQAVTLTTAHGAKGLEFDYVFIVKALDGKFGNNKVRELIKLPPDLLSVVEGPETPLRQGSEDSLGGAETLNEDERRLFYVALTRARRGVFVSYADSYFSDAVAREASPSMFLAEIGPDKRQDLDVAAYEKGVRQVMEEILEPVASDLPSVEEKDYLKTILLDFKLSVTALNTYLECPYKFKLNTLLRTPRAKDKYLAFGSAIHKALEMLLRKFKNEDRLPVAQYLLDQFAVALRDEILTEGDEADILRKGRKILEAYYDFYKGDFNKPVFTEKFFGYGFSKVYLGDVPLTGKVDRIDFLGGEGSAGRRVKVVDYKTGRVRTRNQIEGKTKEADLSYKRQLVFYKLLADLDRAFNYEVVEAELDFVEGSEGKFVKHAFVISPAEIEELKVIIKEVMGKIRHLEFPRTTNYDFCTYCEFSAHCWPQGIPSKAGQLSIKL